jgi:hypothetical protein
MSEEIIFTTTDKETIRELRDVFEVVDVDYINPVLINRKLLNRPRPVTEQVSTINKMIDLVFSSKHKSIYTKQTDYLCNREKRICICNLNADTFRKIYGGANYKKDEIYIAWLRE